MPGSGTRALRLGCLDLTDELAPGWYSCRYDRWLAAEPAAERMRRET